MLLLNKTEWPTKKLAQVLHEVAWLNMELDIRILTHEYEIILLEELTKSFIYKYH